MKKAGAKFKFINQRINEPFETPIKKHRNSILTKLLQTTQVKENNIGYKCSPRRLE
jgi:hypothetical protein